MALLDKIMNRKTSSEPLPELLSKLSRKEKELLRKQRALLRKQRELSRKQIELSQLSKASEKEKAQAESVPAQENSHNLPTHTHHLSGSATLLESRLRELGVFRSISRTSVSTGNFSQFYHYPLKLKIDREGASKHALRVVDYAALCEVTLPDSDLSLTSPPAGSTDAENHKLREPFTPPNRELFDKPIGIIDPDTPILRG
jgi:hypothetical protein